VFQISLTLNYGGRCVVFSFSFSANRRFQLTRTTSQFLGFFLNGLFSLYNNSRPFLSPPSTDIRRLDSCFLWVFTTRSRCCLSFFPSPLCFSLHGVTNYLARRLSLSTFGYYPSLLPCPQPPSERFFPFTRAFSSPLHSFFSSLSPYFGTPNVG